MSAMSLNHHLNITDRSESQSYWYRTLEPSSWSRLASLLGSDAPSWIAFRATYISDDDPTDEHFWLVEMNRLAKVTYNRDLLELDSVIDTSPHTLREYFESGLTPQGAILFMGTLHNFLPGQEVYGE